MIRMQIPDGDAYFRRVFSRSDRFQAELFKAALRFTRGRRLAVDVGAHVGGIARQMAEHFAEVYAFEPHPENFACLQENTRGLAITRMDVAIGDGNGFCDMVKHGENSGCWRVVTGGAVRVVPLDAFNLRHADLIKIDVEGYEGQVIRGAVKTINEWAPVIAFEDNGLGPKLYGDAWVDPKKLLVELGYRRRTRINKDEIWTA